MTVKGKDDWCFKRREVYPGNDGEVISDPCHSLHNSPAPVETGNHAGESYNHNDDD
ncbi:hypothetical protein [Alteromonas gilva]|uniref:Uncharacterized protein n=1 Tax=Alteromonas gilva TaxID=2987522 RepID=A0ABT5L5E4_9ALTE|nr:hypothetical protein [Alteromonas gilva]MDC8831082.1 hypothetical protein [Alteromonas gilva]